MADSSRTRPGGRDANQLRALSSEYGPLHRADGSAQFSHGGTSALAGVFGPGQPRSAAKERSDRARLEVLLRPAVGLPTPAHKAAEALIRQSLESVLRLEEHPGAAIQLTVQVVSDEGSVAAVAFNAAVLALVDAGIPMQALALACTVALIKGEPVLDPEAGEEEAAEAVLTLAFRGTDGGVTASQTRGLVTAEQYLVCAEAALRASQSMQAFVRMSLS